MGCYLEGAPITSIEAITARVTNPLFETTHLIFIGVNALYPAKSEDSWENYITCQKIKSDFYLLQLCYITVSVTAP